MFLGAASHDPRRWATPQHPDPPFGLARDPSRHVGFGVGINQCIGQHVARLEAEAVITALPRRELTGTPRHHNNTLRDPHSSARAPCLTQTAEPNDR